jgi:hypothetical protein
LKVALDCPYHQAHCDTDANCLSLDVFVLTLSQSLEPQPEGMCLIWTVQHQIIFWHDFSDISRPMFRASMSNIFNA